MKDKKPMPEMLRKIKEQASHQDFNVKHDAADTLGNMLPKMKEKGQSVVNSISDPSLYKNAGNFGKVRQALSGAGNMAGELAERFGKRGLKSLPIVGGLAAAIANKDAMAAAGSIPVIGEAFDAESLGKGSDTAAGMEPAFPTYKNPVQVNPQFEKLKSNMADADYNDAAAAKAANMSSLNGHGADEFKLSNHPTFSKDSAMSNPLQQGGEWKGNSFTPSPHNLHNMPPEQMQQYFNGEAENNPEGLNLPNNMKVSGRPFQQATKPTNDFIPDRNPSHQQDALQSEKGFAQKEPLEEKSKRWSQFMNMMGGK